MLNDLTVCIEHIEIYVRIHSAAPLEDGRSFSDTISSSCSQFKESASHLLECRWWCS